MFRSVCILVLAWVWTLPTSPAFSPSSAGARPPDTVDWGRVHATTMRGIDRFYRLDTKGAIQAFDSVARMAPGDPRGYFFRGIVHFSLYALERDRAQFDAFMRQSDYVITVCEQLLDNNPHDSQAKFYLGGTYGYRGMMWQTDGSLIRAVTEGRKGYSYLEEAVEERPDLYDARMGFGLFRYLVAKAPRSLRWMLNLLGITPDLDGGLKMLQTAAEKGTYTRNEARLYLAQFLFTEDRHEEAFEHLNQLCREYPENTLFLVLRASWKQRLGRSDEALTDALNAIEYNNRHPLRYVEEIANGTAGSIFYSRNDFQAARRYYEPYVDSLRNTERIRNWTWYRIGVVFELTGDRQRARSIYNRLREGSDDLRPSESTYYRRSRRLLTHPLSRAETNIIKAENAFNSKAYADALTLYTAAVTLANDDADVRARGLYGMMQAQYELEQYTELEQTSRQLFAMKPDQELWVLPYGYFKLGQAYSRSGKRREAEQAFGMIESYDNYDFQDRLESRLEEEMEKLKALKE